MNIVCALVPPSASSDSKFVLGRTFCAFISILLTSRVVRCECIADAFREVYHYCIDFLDVIFRLFAEEHNRSIACHFEGSRTVRVLCNWKLDSSFGVFLSSYS